jgi:hypothetical protein
MKKIKQLAAVIAVSGMLAACSSTPLPQELESKVVMFERETADLFEKQINALSKEGWSYQGPLCDNGINATYVLFQRRKTGK